MKNYDEYKDALEQAKINMCDVEKRGNEAVGEDALEFMDSFLSDEEIAESDLRADLINELIKARQEKGISQKKLEELSGVKQPVIARMEKGSTNPQIKTVLKILAPLGKTLAIVPIDNSKWNKSRPKWSAFIFYFSSLLIFNHTIVSTNFTM